MAPIKSIFFSDNSTEIRTHNIYLLHLSLDQKFDHYFAAWKNKLRNFAK